MEHGAVSTTAGREESRICGFCGGGYTSVRVEVIGGVEVYACDSCLERAANTNFIWLCLQCRRVYLKPKKLVVEESGDMELRAWYLRCMNDQVVQGIDRCVACEAEDALLAEAVVA